MEKTPALQIFRVWKKIFIQFHSIKNAVAILHNFC